MLTKYIDMEIEYAEANREMCPNGQCSIVKTAEERPQDIFDGIKILKNHAYLFVIAMGAGDYYNENKNGDFFWEKDLIQYHKKFLNAGIFIQHDNKDPNKSIGKVLKAEYNHDMHRVELLLEIKKELAPQIYESISNGERIAVSMGVKVPGESCSYCGQVTKGSIANRCEHLKFHMHQIMPNGIKVFAINHTPLNFFDISVVRKPADHQGYALFQKVASLEEEGNYYGSSYKDKVAGLKKIAELTKRIDALSSYNPLNFKMVSKLREMPKPLLKNFIKSNDLLLHPAEYISLFNHNVDPETYEELIGMSPEDIHGFFSFISKHAAYSPNENYQVKIAMRTNDAMDYLVARNTLIKEADLDKELKMRRADSFGHKELEQRKPTNKMPFGFNRYALIRVKLKNGEEATQPANDFFSVFSDLIDEGAVSEINGILPNGRETLIMKSDDQ